VTVELSRQDDVRTSPSTAVLLDAYAARSCPVKTHNAFDPTVSIPPVESGGRLTELFDGAQQFEAVVLEQLITSCRGRVVDLRLLAEHPPAERTRACLAAMESGAEVIIAGLLPVDGPGHRVGRPDLLVRGADGPGGHPAYHPAAVKWHKVVERARPSVPADSGAGSVSPASDGARTPGSDPDEPAVVHYSTLDQPAPADASTLAGHTLRLGSRGADFLQLAHYHRMLQSCGFAATPALGAVIGTDGGAAGTFGRLGSAPTEGLPSAPVLAWAELERPSVRTFSRSHPEGWRLRSLLERYDFEHEFRVAIAEVATRQTGHPDTDPLPLVRPIVNAECGRCHWWEHCRPQLDPDDVSLRIDKGALDAREIVTLRRHGIGTVTDLAEVDLDHLLTWYLPEVTHRSGAEVRIRTAARRARMLREGRWFDRETSGPIEVPRAVVEIDFDIESAADGRVYLWGFLVQRDDEPAVYHEFSRFSVLDELGELQLAREAFEWLRSVVEAGEPVVVYHYSGYEVAKIRGLADRTCDPLLDWAAEYAEEQFVDLLEIVKAHYFGVAGLGLKLMAAHAGFSWRDDDPGGLNSQVWFTEAVHAESPPARAAARRRVLEYNEDDVIATSALRAWLRAQ
jgi:predicted RecB family nuclease